MCKGEKPYRNNPQGILTPSKKVPKPCLKTVAKQFQNLRKAQVYIYEAPNDLV